MDNTTVYDTRNEAINVDDTPAVVISDPHTRKLWLVKNISTGGQVITISLGKLAVAGSGFILSPGDSIGESEDIAYTPFSGSISAVASVAGGQISLVER